MFSKKKIVTLLSSTAPLLLLQSPFVAAQSEGFALEEIVVTANKRNAQSVQDITGSIQAIGSDTLERTLTEGIEDYIKLVPGLTTVSSGTGQSQIIIRGVNSARVIHTDAQQRSLAGLYLDEMPISLTGFNPDLGTVDIERVEVLRGPQGTLYGASSMSGTIRVITKQPSVEEFSGKVSIDASSTEDGDPSYGLKGSVNIPMSDTWAMRINAYATEKGGFIDNVEPTNAEDDYNSEDTIGGRLQIAYYGDKLTASANFIYNNLEADGRADAFFENTGEPLLSPITDELQTVKFVDDPFENEFKAFNLTLEYDFGNVILTSASSAFDVEVTNSLDDTFRILAVTPIPATFSDFRNDTELSTFVQELRLQSNYDSPLQWIAGAYYETNDKDFAQTQPTPGTNAFFEGLTAIGAFPPNLCGTLVTTCFGAVQDSVFDGLEEVDTDQLAFFGEATFSFTDALRLTLGLRWFDYESDVSIFAAGPANDGISLDVVTIEEDDVVPKVELSYDISEDAMIYATFSEGFRLGGVNGFIPAATDIPCDTQLAALGTFSGAPFESDSLTNIELGAKTSWADNRLVANVAVYQIEFDDLQTTINLDCGFFQKFNGGTVENTGIEADIALQATEELSVRFGFSYVDSEVTSAVPGVSAKDDTPPYVVEFTASGSIQYLTSVWDGTGYIRSDIRHVGSLENEFTSNPNSSKIDSYTIVDLTLGYETDGWAVQLFARNLFDEEVVTNIDPDRVQPAQLTRARPRTVGVSLTKHF